MKMNIFRSIKIQKKMNKSIQKIKNIAIDTINKEAESVKNLVKYINDDFVAIVNCIFNSDGRVIITGIGKSAIIANKIVSTLNSTGTPAIFMHAADAIHGDLGIVRTDDIVICISKSGNTPEIKVLAPLIKNMGNTLIGLVSNTNSFLAQQSDYILASTVVNEACPNNLAPTSSTTAQLVMGDALAVSLLDLRGFSTGDFAKFHPGGSLGKKLYLKVFDIYFQNEKPIVNLNSKIEEIIMEISSKRLGVTAVLDDNKELLGIITDGDLRRMLQLGKDIKTLSAKDIMTNNPKTIDEQTLAINAFGLMEENKITQLVVTKNNKFAGFIHLHDILREGII